MLSAFLSEKEKIAHSKMMKLIQPRLFIPIEEDSEQHIYIIDKDAQGNITTKKQYGVRYVPLTDAPKAP
jgi:protein-L-isoaspartate O-methyltransferase